MSPPTDSHRLRQRIGLLAFVATGLSRIGRNVADLPFGTIKNPGTAVTPLGFATVLVALGTKWVASCSDIPTLKEPDYNARHYR